MGRFTFGVDIGGTAVKVGLFSDTEELISHGRSRPGWLITVHRSFLM